jgi:hypothetical protein
LNNGVNTDRKETLTTGFSIYRNQANTVHKWCPFDTHELWIYHRNNTEKKAALDSLNWTEDSITYKFNSHGFRSDEFDGDGIVFLGCSLTVGIGMDLERTWAHLISTKLNLKNWNLGQGAGANDTCFRLGDYWIPKLKPKMVCMLSPSKYRIEIVKPHSIIEPFLPNSKRSLKKDLYNDWLSTDANGKLNAKKNIDALAFLCNQLEIPFYYLSADETMANGGGTHDGDYGRDLLHPGYLWNIDIANHFLSVIEHESQPYS